MDPLGQLEIQVYVVKSVMRRSHSKDIGHTVYIFISMTFYKLSTQEKTVAWVAVRTQEGGAMPLSARTPPLTGSLSRNIRPTNSCLAK